MSLRALRASHVVPRIARVADEAGVVKSRNAQRQLRGSGEHLYGPRATPGKNP
jgi:hypothetical protein